jgi:hypothetical protein
MELCYRGIGYQSKPQTMPNQSSAQAVSPQENRPIIGKYRGVSLQLNSFPQTNAPQAPLKLTYRGATYFR